MRNYDGLICFGGADWWYHNRGHYDMQMCGRFARRVPVLYVNSIGVRSPSLSEGSMFLRRVGRKLRSWSRGYQRIHETFAVVSPISIPGRFGRSASGRILPRQVRRAASRMGIAEPLLWIECPTAAALLDDLDGVGLVYQRTDRYEQFPGVDRAFIEDCDRRLKREADLTLFCSTYLYEREAVDCRVASFIDHGVDYERFENAGIAGTEPADMGMLGHPRVGFVGGIDEHTFDADIFLEVARSLPHLTFVMVGSCSLPAGWCTLPNVVFLGQKPYEQVADYMAACDVLIMPWNRNDWIRACNPVKLKEYLAVGRPVVSTSFEELKRYAEHVQVAGDADAFAEAIRSAIEDPGDPATRRDRVRGETWAAKAEAVEQQLKQVGLDGTPRDVDDTATRAAGGRAGTLEGIVR
jgi:glycosyltransferase involved in cell wall biosynthesis